MACIGVHHRRKIKKFIRQNPTDSVSSILDNVIDLVSEGKVDTLISLQENNNLKTVQKYINEGLQSIELDTMPENTLKNQLKQKITNKLNGLNTAEYSDVSSTYNLEQTKNTTANYEAALRGTYPISSKKQMSLTPEKVINRFFPKEPEMYRELNNKFTQEVYKFIGFDEHTGYVPPEIDRVLNARMKNFIKEIDRKLGSPGIKEAHEELQNSGDLAEQMILRDNTNLKRDAYLYNVMKQLVPHLVVNNFKNNIEYVPGSNEYRFIRKHNVLSDGILDKPVDGMSGFGNYLHLSTTPFMQKVPKTKNQYEIIPGRYISEKRLKQFIRQHPDFNELVPVENAMGENIKNFDLLQKKFPELIGIYNRYWNPNPYYIAGDTRPRYSLTWAKNNAPSVQERRRAEMIITEFERKLFDSKPASYVNFENGKAIIPKVGGFYNASFTQTINDKLNTLLQNNELDVFEYNNSTDVITLNVNGKKVEFELEFKSKGSKKADKHNRDNPLRAKLVSKGKNVDRLAVFNFLGFGTDSNLNTFIDKFNVDYKDTYKNTDGGMPIDTLLGTIAYFSYLNTLDPKDHKSKPEAIKHLTKRTTYETSKIKQVISENQNSNILIKIPPSAYATTLMQQANKVVQDVIGLEKSDKIYDHAGNMMPLNLLRNRLSNIKLDLKANEEGNLKSSVWNNNVFKSSNESAKLVDIHYALSYRDETTPDGIPHTKMNIDQEAKASINAAWANTVLDSENQQSAIVHFNVAADKNLQPYAQVHFEEGLLPLNTMGMYDRKPMMKRYEDSIVSYWVEIEKGVINRYLDVFNKMGIKYDPKKLTSLKALDEFLAESEIPFVEASKFKLFQGHDIVKGPKGAARIKPDFVAYMDIQKDPALLTKYLNKKLGDFIKKYTSNEMGKKINFKFSEDVTEKFNKKYGKQWESGEVVNGQGEVHPLMESYFFTQLVVSNNIRQVLQGNIFQYKDGYHSKVFNPDGSINFNELDVALKKPTTDLVKRAPSYVSSTYTPILAEKGANSRKLGQESTVIQVHDKNAKVLSLAEGRYLDPAESEGKEGQEGHDGAFYVHEIYRLMLQNSYGADKGTLNGMHTKAMSTGTDYESGLTFYEKKAEHPITLSRIKESVGSPLDLSVLNKIMLMGTGFNSPIHINHLTEDGNYRLDEAFNNLYEVWEKLGGTDNPKVNEEVVEIIYKYPEIRNTFAEKLSITSSIKVGAHSVNPDLETMVSDFKADPESIKGISFSKVNNFNHGVQFNPNHPMGHNEVINNIAPINQMENALAANGASTIEAQNVFKAKALIIDHLRESELKVNNVLEDPSGYVQDLLDQYAKRADSSKADVLNKAKVNGQYNLNDLKIADIAISQLNARLEKAAVSPKFNGGQFVVMSTSDTYQVYDIDGKVMSRTVAEKYLMKEYGNKNLIDNYIPRNLSWVKYIDTSIEGSPVDLTASFLFESLSVIQLPGYTLNMYNERQKYSEENPDIPTLPKVSSIKEAKKWMRIEYHKLMDSGKYEMIPGEIVLPNIFKKTYGLREGDSIDEIIQNPDYFINNQGTLGRSPRNIRYLALKNLQEGKLNEEQYKEMQQQHPDILPDGSTAEATAILISHARELHSSFIKAMKGVDARIPGSGKQSGHPFKVVGFLNDMDNVVGIPVESMLVKGEDLDIDKGNIQLASITPDGSMQGIAYPYFTKEGKNKHGGGLSEALSYQQIAEQYPTDFEHLNFVYGSDKWYVQGLLNYYVEVAAEILGNPRNMIEANVPVSIDMLKDLANTLTSEESVTVDDPNFTLVYNTLNKVAKTMVGVEATGFKVFLALYHSIQQQINAGEVGLNGSSPAFRVNFSEGSILGGPYTDLADTKSAYYSKARVLLKDLNSEELVKFKSILEEEYEKIEEKDRVSDIFSALVNAATDNAKDPILGKLRINELTGSYVSAGVVLGIPLKAIVGRDGIINDPTIAAILDEAERNNTSIAEAIKKLHPDDKPDVVTDFEKLGNIGKEMRFMGRVLQINGEIPNSLYEVFAKTQDLNKEIGETLYGKTSNYTFNFISWINSTPFEQDERIEIYEQKKAELGKVINPLKVIKNNPNYLSQLKTFAAAYEILSEALPHHKSVIRLAEKIQKKTSATMLEEDPSGVEVEVEDQYKKYKVDEKIFNQLKNLYYAEMNHEFLAKNMHDTVIPGVGKFDLTSDGGRFRFVRAVNKYLPMLQKKYASQNNQFINSLKQKGFNDLFDNTYIPYVGIINLDDLHSQGKAVIEADLHNLDQADKDILYTYNLIMANSRVRTHTFLHLFNEQITPLVKKYNEFTENYKVYKKGEDKIISKALTLIPEFYTKVDGLSGSMHNMVKVLNKKTGNYEYYNTTFNEQTNQSEYAQVYRSYKSAILALSTNERSIFSVPVDGEQEMQGPELLEEQEAPTRKGGDMLFFNTSQTFDYNTNKFLGTVIESLDKNPVERINSQSSYQNNLIADVIVAKDDSFIKSSAIESKGKKGKNLVITNSEVLSDQEQDKLIRDNNKVVFVGNEGEPSIEASREDLDAFAPIIKSLDVAAESSDPFIRERKYNYSTNAIYVSEGNLIEDLLTAKDGIIITETPEKYTDKIRKELFGNKANSLINKGEHLIDGEGIYYSASKVTFNQGQSIQDPTNSSEIIILQGYNVKMVSRDGNTKNVFIPLPDQLAKYEDRINKIKVSLESQPKVVRDEFNKQYTEFGSDLSYGYALTPERVNYSFTNVLLDENSFYDQVEDNEVRNDKIKKAYLSSNRNVKVLSDRYYKLNDSINTKTSEAYQRKIKTALELVKDPHDSSPKGITNTGIVNFSNWINDLEMPGINVESVTSSEILQEGFNPEYENYTTFEEKGKIYINEDLVDYTTPIYQLSHVWLKKFAQDNKKVYNNLVNHVIEKHPMAAELTKKMPDVSNNVIVSNVVSKVLRSDLSKITDPELMGYLNELINSIKPSLNTLGEDINPNMSLSKMIQKLTDQGIQNVLTHSITEVDQLILAQMHGAGSNTKLLELIKSKLKVSDNYKNNCK